MHQQSLPIDTALPTRARRAADEHVRVWTPDTAATPERIARELQAAADLAASATAGDRAAAEAQMKANVARARALLRRTGNLSDLGGLANRDERRWALAACLEPLSIEPVEDLGRTSRYDGWHINDVISDLLQERIPWLAEDREPTPAEVRRTVVRIAEKRFYIEGQTAKRACGRELEQDAEAVCLDAGLHKVEPADRKRFPLEDLDAGTFAMNVHLDAGTRRIEADLAIRVSDDEVLLIEAKHANDTTNSAKRTKRMEGDARTWRDRGVTLVALLGGMFNEKVVTEAAAAGLTLLFVTELEAFGTYLRDAAPDPYEGIS